jgi:hypothetical protein
VDCEEAGQRRGREKEAGFPSKKIQSAQRLRHTCNHHRVSCAELFWADCRAL